MRGIVFAVVLAWIIAIDVISWIIAVLSFKRSIAEARAKGVDEGVTAGIEYACERLIPIVAEMGGARAVVQVQAMLAREAGKGGPVN